MDFPYVIQSEAWESSEAKCGFALIAALRLVSRLAMTKWWDTHTRNGHLFEAYL